MESFEQTGDPEILTRMAQYEMAYRMQRSIPELTDLSHETKATFDLYGEDARQPGDFANHCLMARRLAERMFVSSSSSTEAGIITPVCRPTSRRDVSRPIKHLQPSSRT